MFAERDKHYPSRFGQTSLATAITNITKPVTKIYSGISILYALNTQTNMDSLSCSTNVSHINHA